MAGSILYLGHPYHAFTRSTAFMVDLLRELGPVRVETAESWDGEITEDLVFVFQSEEIAQRVARQGRPFIFAPMYDSSGGLGRRFWQDEFRGLARILCFSRRQYEQLRDWDLDCFFVRFFPPPESGCEWPEKSALRGSFWWRLEALPLDTVLTLAGKQLERLHIHLAPDPGQTIDESACARSAVPIEVTRWGADRSNYAKALAGSRVFFAPRRKEGIGMSFLEAMAAGRVVVAVDDATQNEYVTDGVTGFLYDPDHPREVPLDRVGIMGERARESMRQGWEEWMESRSRLLSWIQGEPPPVATTGRRATDGVEVFVKDTGSKSELEMTLNSLATAPRIYSGTRPRGTKGRWSLDLWAGDELLVDLPEILRWAPAGAARVIGHYLERTRSKDYEHRVSLPERMVRRGFAGAVGLENFLRMPHPSAELFREDLSGETWHCDRTISRVRDRGFAWKCEWNRAAAARLLADAAGKKLRSQLTRRLIRRDFERYRADGLNPWSNRDAAKNEILILAGMVFNQGARAALRRFLTSFSCL